MISEVVVQENIAIGPRPAISLGKTVINIVKPHRALIAPCRDAAGRMLDETFLMTE